VRFSRKRINPSEVGTQPRVFVCELMAAAIAHKYRHGASIGVVALVGAVSICRRDRHRIISW